MVFLGIHPFQDGNGRISRILLHLMLLQHGADYVRFNAFEKIIEGTRMEYYRALMDTQESWKVDESAAKFNPWISYLLRGLLTQAEKLERLLKLEPVE